MIMVSFLKRIKYIVLGYFLLCLALTGCSYNNKSFDDYVLPKVEQEKSINKDTIQTDTQKQNHSLKEVDGLISLLEFDNSIVIDLRYATVNNFTGKRVYPFKTCLLRKETAKKLQNVNNTLKEKGYRIKVYDGYRPPFAQEIFWNLVKDERYVASPKRGGSIHSKGCAVDVTIIDMSGNELEMPSEFDDFTDKASRKNPNMSQKARNNLELLTKVMTDNGFNYINTEWWHYNDAESNIYKVIDINPALFEQ